MLEKTTTDLIAKMSKMKYVASENQEHTFGWENNHSNVYFLFAETKPKILFIQA